MRRLFTCASAAALVGAFSMAAVGWAADATDPSSWATTVNSEANISTGASVKLADTMNWPDCTRNDPRIARCKKIVKKCGPGWWSPVVGYNYHEPVVISEVTCRSGQSPLMGESPIGKALTKTLFGALKTPDTSKCMETQAKKGEVTWFFEVHAFGVTPMARFMAATGNSRKFAAYQKSMAMECDILTNPAFQKFMDGMDFAKGSAFTDAFSKVGNVYDAGNLSNLDPTGSGLLNGMNGFNLLASGSIQGAAGELMGGTLGNALSPLTTGLNDAAGNLTSALSGGGSTMDTTTPAATSSGGSGGAFGGAGSAVSQASTLADRVAAFGASPVGLAMGQLGQYMPMGLIPIFVSEFSRPAWTTNNPLDIKAGAGTALNVAGGSTGQLIGGSACGATSLIDDASSGLGVGTNITSMMNDASLGMLSQACVGVWGPNAPVNGYTNNKIRPVAAALVGYRGFYNVGLTSKTYKNPRGTPMFNMDYPFINTGVAGNFIKSVTPFAKGNHGQKGSGCYNPGTMDPRWYTAGENFLPDPSQGIQDMAQQSMQAATGAKVTVNNGDYVFSYWRNTRCCIPIECPYKAWKE